MQSTWNEVRERAIRLVMDLVEDPGGPSINGACLRVGEQLGINGDTLRNWVQQAWVDAGKQPGVTTEDKDLGPCRIGTVRVTLGK